MVGRRAAGSGRGGSRPFRAVFLVLMCLALPSLADPPGPPVRGAAMPGHLRPPPRPVALGRADLRCTADGAHCIALASYTADVCRTIEAAAAEAGLDRDFFARLIWRESLFDAAAVSPAGAQGIAQFMPGTARLRRLDDPFNPARALRASAFYLAELRDRYGNLGLAAAAYNAGEERVEAFLRRDRTLPLETRRYVPAITGVSAWDWRDAPPETLALDLDAQRPFRQACAELAESRAFRAFRNPDVFQPWAVILAANPREGIVAARVAQLRRGRPVLEGLEIGYRRMRLPGRSGRQVAAQIGAGSRAEAQRLCNRLAGRGVPCIVLRN